MNQITEINNIVGRKISQVLKSYGDLWVKFDDDTFAVFIPKTESIGSFGNCDSVVDISDWTVDKTDHELVKLGLISEKEYQDATKKEEEKELERRILEEEAVIKRRMDEELNQLKILKEKYENGITNN